MHLLVWLLAAAVLLGIAAIIAFNVWGLAPRLATWIPPYYGLYDEDISQKYPVAPRLLGAGFFALLALFAVGFAFR